MPMTKWSDIRKVLDSWSKPALLALLKDFYELSSTNRDFFYARSQTNEENSEALEQYRRKIIEQFFPTNSFGKLKLSEARKAIREYRKATGNLVGTVDLLLTYVENGTKFTREFGDINEAFYNSLESAMHELVKLLWTHRNFYPRFRERILSLEKHADHIGWGYGDFLRDQVMNIEGEFEEGM